MTAKEEVLVDIFKFNARNVNYLVNISEKYKYIYFETPKVGCSTIKRTLQQLEVDDTSEELENIHDKSLSPLLSPLDLEKPFNLYLNMDYFKFSFVRNPYTRILSCYLDKMCGLQKDTYLPKLGFKSTDNISFTDFLIAVKKQTYSEMDIHWKPQSVLLAEQKITLDFIGRQENFDNDLRNAIARIKKEPSGIYKILVERPHSVGANKKLTKYLTKDCIKLIQEIYYDDFYLYGYSTDPYSTEPLPDILDHYASIISNEGVNDENVQLLTYARERVYQLELSFSKLQNEMAQRDEVMRNLLNYVSKMVQISIMKHPVKKLNAYKKMIKYYIDHAVKKK